MNEITILDGIGTTARGVVVAIIPLLLLFITFQSLFLKLPSRYTFNLLKGTLLSGVGLFLFLQGVNAGFLPYGRLIGEALGAFNHKWLLIFFGFFLGFLTTWGEPAVRILCDQVEKASAGAIRKSTVLYTICVGVALFVALGMTRITYSIPLLYILIPGYALVIAMLWFSEKEFLSVAFDAGGVATGPIANTFLLGLGLGVASAGSGESLIVHGLGLIALIALAPIISVIWLGFIFRVRTRYRG